MTKRIGIMTKSNIRFYTVKKTNRPIVQKDERVYRIDDDVCIAHAEKPEHICLYDVDSTQPYGHGEYLNPSMTKIYILSMKQAHKKIDVLSGFSANKLVLPLIIIAIIGSIAYTVIG